MDVIDRAVEHFEAFGLQKIEVPEWAAEPGKPFFVYFHPITLAEIQKLEHARVREGEIARLADALILKALTEDGKKMFTLEHKLKLRTRVSPDVIARVAKYIIGFPTPEDMEKNLRRTPASS